MNIRVPSIYFYSEPEISVEHDIALNVLLVVNFAISLDISGKHVSVFIAFNFLTLHN